MLKEHNPQSVRQVFYRCLERDGVASVKKNRSGYQRVQGAIRDMRRDRRIPWAWIVDETRVTNNYDYGYSTWVEFVSNMESSFALDFWAREIGSHVEIWTESRGVEASIARPVAQKWRCSSTAFGGQPSDGLLYECARRIKNREYQTLILYCGDLDAHGFEIEEKPRDKLREIWGCNPDWLRVLVNPDQVTAYNLPSDEDRKAVQAEAFPINDARGLLRQAITSLSSDLVDKITLHKQREARFYMDLKTEADSLDRRNSGEPVLSMLDRPKIAPGTPRQRSGRDQTRFEIAAAIARHRLAEHEAELAAEGEIVIPPDVAKDLRKLLRLPSTNHLRAQ